MPEGDETDLILGTTHEVMKDPTVRDLVTRVLGPPATESGELLAMPLRWWRTKYAVRLLQKTHKLLEEAGIKPEQLQHVEPRVWVPLIESGSLEGDENLQDRWAALLANAAVDPDGVPPSFPFILGQLTPTDARLLEMVFDAANADSEREWYETDINLLDLAQDAGLGGRDFQLALDNLIRLRVVNTQATYGALAGKTVLLTTLGHELVRACGPPAAPTG